MRETQRGTWDTEREEFKKIQEYSRHFKTTQDNLRETQNNLRGTQENFRGTQKKIIGSQDNSRQRKTFQEKLETIKKIQTIW